MRYFDAVTNLAMVAEIHGTDAAVVKQAKLYAKLVQRKYRPRLYEVINAPSPLAYIIYLVATIPDHILKMDPSDPKTRSEESKEDEK